VVSAKSGLTGVSAKDAFTGHPLVFDNDDYSRSS